MSHSATGRPLRLPQMRFSQSGSLEEPYMADSYPR
jgi:hypothetical protein